MSRSTGVNTCFTQRERGGQPVAELLTLGVNFGNSYGLIDSLQVPLFHRG